MNLTIDALHQQYRQGSLTPEKLLSELLEKAKAYSNAWIYLLSLDEIQPYLDNLQGKSPDDCPLWGIPFAIKDNIDLAHIPTTAACPEFSYVPKKSAYVVEQLIAAGAIPIGKTNLDQFATGLVGTRSPYGAVPNTFNKAYISGGSSSGSAVATAAGFVTFALGTDTAGSGRVPACFNNLIGLKPSKGILSTTGVVPACKSLDCVSIFSLTAQDAKSILNVAADFDDTDCFARTNPVMNQGNVEFPAQFTFAVPLPEQLAFFGSNTYEASYFQAITQLEALGGTKVEVDFSPFLDAATLLYEGPWVAERFVATKDIITHQPESMMDVTRTIISSGDKPKATDAFSALYKLQALKQIADKVIASVDVVVAPTAGRHFTIEEIEQEPILRNSQLGYYTNFMNLLDLSAVAVPTSFTTENMPFGITIFSDAMKDQKLLSLADKMQAQQMLPLGATKIAYASVQNLLPASKGFIDVVVAGAHLSGMALNWQLTERGGYLKEKTQTSESYAMYAIAGQVERPALVKDINKGKAFNVEVWTLPISEFGSFVEGIAAPLGIGKVELASGDIITGFIAEGYAADIGQNISQYAGWREYKAS